MIKIPFDRCFILTTLDFEQISERLATAIHDPRFPPRDANSTSTQRYFGHIRGFKFSASPLLGHKHFHLPFCLSPTIEGNINAIATGYEISLTAKLQNLTLVLLLTWLGGILTACSAAFEKVLLNIDDVVYGRTLYISIFLYLATIAYLYFASWRTTRFFRSLFAHGLTGRQFNGSQLQPQSLKLRPTSTDLAER
jgi:hypothetical protein